MNALDQLEKKSGTALVLSGGASKAFYFHLGVLRVIEPDQISSIVGTSAGSIIGALIASGVTPENLINTLKQRKIYVEKLDAKVKRLTSRMLFKPNYFNWVKQSLYNSVESLKFIAALPLMVNRDIVGEALDRAVSSQSHVTGFFDSTALEDIFRDLLPTQNFEDTEIDLYVIATMLDGRARAIFNGKYDLDDEKNSFMTDVPLSKAVKASSALPGLFEPVKIHDQYYVDGEVRRSLSVDIGLHLADRVIVSHTYQPLQLNDKGNSVRDMGWIHILKQSAWIALYERIEAWREIYEEKYPNKDIIWIHPAPDDEEFFRAPEFSFRPEIQKMMIRCGENAAKKALNL